MCALCCVADAVVGMYEKFLNVLIFFFLKYQNEHMMQEVKKEKIKKKNQRIRKKDYEHGKLCLNVYYKFERIKRAWERNWKKNREKMTPNGAEKL